MPCPNHSECPITRPSQGGPDTVADGDGEEVVVPSHALL